MHDVSSLFDPAVELRAFSTSSISHIPEAGSIIYSVFLDRTEFIYVGIGDLAGKTFRKRMTYCYIGGTFPGEGRRAG
jgi:hypothetical protein